MLNGDKKFIHFTNDVECDQKLSYLDMTLQRTYNFSITTEYYQKPTSKKSIIEFPLIQRTSMAYGTISRILSLTSLVNR